MRTHEKEELRQEQGEEKFYIPKNERTRQRPFDDRLQAKLEWFSQNWRTYFAQPSSSASSSRKIGGYVNMSVKSLNGVDTKTLNSGITIGKITNIMIGLKI